jgi:hypothetical protein
VALQRVTTASTNIRIPTNYTLSLQVPAAGDFALLANV